MNLLTLKSDQDKISPYDINTISSRQVMRIRKNIWELLGDLIPNSPNKNHNNGMADVRRITNRIFGVKGLRQALKYRYT